jgi:hypothetical protein
MGFGMLFIVGIVGVGLVGLKYARKYSKMLDRVQREATVDSIREARYSAERSGDPIEDSAERIDILRATVTGLRGYERITIPYASHRDTITRLLGNPTSVAPSNVVCLPKTLLHYYGRNTIEIDSDGKAVMRKIDLMSNPEIEVSAGQFILSRRTTLSSYQRRFPYSADHRTPQGYYILRPVRRKPGERLHLTFDTDGHLAYIQYYMGC